MTLFLKALNCLKEAKHAFKDHTVYFNRVSCAILAEKQDKTDGKLKICRWFEFCDC